MPVRFIAESIGAKVDWDAQNKIILISTENTEYKVIEVNNANEFINAIGSNRKIVLKNSEYNLSRPQGDYVQNKYVRWDNEYDGKELVIQNVNNLTIEGLDKTLSSILVEPRSVDVLTFENCSEINIVNINAGHTPEKGECSGGVFEFKDSSKINIEKSRLFGCGTQGLSLFNVNNLLLDDSIITDCFQAIMLIYDSTNIKFQDSKFEDNEGYFGFITIKRSLNIVFDQCSISNNTPVRLDDEKTWLFDINESEDIYLRNSEVNNNDIFFANRYTLINIDATTFKNNRESLSEMEAATYTEKGYYNLVNREFKNSLEQFNKAIELDPQNSTAYSYKGHALLFLGRYEEALDECNTSITINPDDYFPHLTKGNVLFELKKYKEAIKSYNNSITLNEFISSSHFGKGRALFELKSYNEAQDAFKKHIKLNRNNTPVSYYYLGTTQFELGKYKEAIASLDKSLELDPKYGKSVYEKSRCYAMLDNLSEAIINLERAINIDEGYKIIAESDKAFENIRNTEEFKNVLGYRK